MRDHRRDVETRVDHHAHLVPGLVHLAAVDALQRQHVEDEGVEVELNGGRRDPEDGDAAAVRHLGDSRAKCIRASGHLEHHVETLAHAELLLYVGKVALARVDGERRTHPAREVEPAGVEIRDDDVPRAGVARHGHGHAADRARTGDEHVLAQHREREGPCERHCRADRRSPQPRRRLRASGATRSSSGATRAPRTRPGAARRGRSSARTGDAFPPCSSGSGRRRRGPRR